MTKKILMGASFLALLAAFPAFAQTEAHTETKAEVSTSGTLGSTLNKVEGALDRTVEKTKAVTKNTVQDVKTYFSNDDDITAVTSLNVSSKLTADELMGASVEDNQGKKIGTVSDVLVDADGDAERVILKDGGVLGLGGKLVAVDYEDMDKLAANGDILVKLSQSDLKTAKSFDDSAVPTGQFLASKLIGSKVVDVEGKNVATVDNIVFDGDEADYVVVNFDKVLGMGGDQAALDFEALDLVNNAGKYSFRLNTQQSAQFANYKQTTKAN